MEHQVRRCVICGGREHKSHFVRFVKVGESIEYDATHTKQGRGMYVHRRLACWNKLNQAQIWARALLLKKEQVEQQDIGRLVTEAQPEVLQSGSEESLRHGRVRL